MLRVVERLKLAAKLVEHCVADALEPSLVEPITVVDDTPNFGHADAAGDARQRRQAERVLDVDDALAGCVERNGRRREFGAFGGRREKQNRSETTIECSRKTRIANLNFSVFCHISSLRSISIGAYSRRQFGCATASSRAKSANGPSSTTIYKQQVEGSKWKKLQTSA